MNSSYFNEERNDIFELSTAPKVLQLYRGDTHVVYVNLKVPSSAINSIIFNCDGLPDATALTLESTTLTASSWKLTLNNSQTLILLPKTHNFTMTVIGLDLTELTLYKGLVIANNRTFSNNSNNYYLSPLIKFVAPTIADNAYRIGTIWIDVVLNRVHVFTSLNDDGEAYWLDVTKLIRDALVGDEPFTAINLNNEVMLTFNGTDVVWSYRGINAEMFKNLILEVEPASGVTFTNGMCVMYAGSIGGSGKRLAKPTNFAELKLNPGLFLGVITQISDDGNGIVNWYGEVNNLNTQDLALGSPVYVGDNGSWTTIKPTSPNPQISIGLIERTHVEQGRIGVRPRINCYLSELHDVYVNGHTFIGGEIIKYNFTNSRWEIFNLDGSLLTISTNISDIQGDIIDINTNLQTLDLNKVDKLLTIIGLDLQNNITLEEFKIALGNATTALDGLLSSEDKVHINNFVTLFENDSTEILNTIASVLQIFETYPEGTDIMTILNEKVDKVTGYGLSKNNLSDELKQQYDAAYTHTSDISNPHSVTKTQVGLENVEDGAQINIIEAIKVDGVDLTPDVDKRITLPNKEPAFEKNTAFNKNFGNENDTVCEGNDARLSDARTPLSHAHDDRYYTESEIDAALGLKVDKVEGETLTPNKYTNDEKSKLSSLDTQAELDIKFGAKEDAANKGVANGYAPLNASGIVDPIYVPGAYADYVEYATYANLPASGVEGTLYVVIADETSGGNTSTYRWTGSIYVNVTDKLSASEVKALYESNANTNAYTDDEKTKLSGIEPSAEVNNISDADAGELTGGEETDLHKHAAADVNITDTGEYYDSTDVEGVLQEVGSELASLANRAQLKPEYAETVEDCTDTTKLYVLPDGYIYAYLKTIIPGGPAYTNLATNFQEGYRLNSSGTAVAQAGATTCTDYISFTPGTVVRIKGFGALLDYNIAIYAYNQVISSSGKANAQGNYASYAYDSASGIVTLTSSISSSAYLRVSGILSGTTADVIITANEEIENSEPVESYEWKSTGLAFVPADYEDRIIELEEDVLVLKNDVKALDGTSSEDATIPSYWEPMVADKTATIKALQEAGGKDCVCFAWAADTHIPDNDGGRTTDIGKVMAKMLDNCEIPFVVLAGDIGTRASYPTEAGLIAAQASMPVHLAPLWGTDRLLMALGNHDGCWGDSSGYYRHQFTPERMWQIYFRGQALDFRRVFSDDGMYFYVDNVAQRTRIIVLNSNFGGEYAVNENGYAVNNRFATSCYGQVQLDWLAEVALDMPEGYNAIITSHVSPNITYTVDKAQFIGIVNAYCNKTTYSGSYTAGVDGWTNNNISVDFTNVKGEIIAMFTGHVHGDSIDTTTMVCPILTILSAGATANEHNGFSEPDSGRTAGTDTETNFDVVTINKATRTIYCTRVGAGSDRQVSY